MIKYKEQFMDYDFCYAVVASWDNGGKIILSFGYQEIVNQGKKPGQTKIVEMKEKARNRLFRHLGAA